MTEQEAREKWCPMGRVLGGVNKGTYNRKEEDGDGSGLSLCLASDCAMWIVDLDARYEPVFFEGQWTRKKIGELPKEEWKGHCGLIRK